MANNKPTFSFGSGGQSPFSLPATTTAQPATTAPAFGFSGGGTSAAAGLFGAIATTTAQAAPTTAAPTITPSAALTSSSAPAQTTAAPAALTSGFSFGAPASAAAPTTTVAATTTAATALPTLSLPTTTATSGFSLGLGAQSTAQSTATTTVAVSATTGSTTTSSSGGFAHLSTATKTTDSSALANKPQMTYRQLEEHINKWTLELEEQEKIFTDQATQINAWDNILISNNEKILELNEAMQKVRADQQTLEQELEFIVTQHKELEESIEPLQKELVSMPQVDAERAQTYLLVETLDTQLKQMTEDLKEIIDRLNEVNKGQDNSDPIIQISKILNAHMTSLQWIEVSTDQISNKLEDITKMHDTFKRETERSFRSAYNN